MAFALLQEKISRRLIIKSIFGFWVYIWGFGRIIGFWVLDVYLVFWAQALHP